MNAGEQVVQSVDGGRTMVRPKNGTRVAAAMAVLATLAVIPYLRTAQLPFIADDYIQISLGQTYGAVSGWPALLQDALYRCRATSLVLTYWTWQAFGLNTLAYTWSSILVHVLNTWLVFGLGLWRFIGWRLSLAAAGFFAVYEGHQEAVVWYSALPELLVFFFCLLAFLSWILWLESKCTRHVYYLLALVSYILALASKESGVVVGLLLLAAAAVERRPWRRVLPAIVPFAALAGFYFLSIYTAQSHHLFFSDGTFSLTAPFWKTLTISTGRLFWFWGLSSLVFLAAVRCVGRLPLVGWAAVWIVVTFLPYSFLTYMPRVPSRHTYLASLGLALVVGAGALAFRDRFQATRSWALPVLVLLLIAHNCGYIWIWKHAQYRERAAATEALIAAARRTAGPIYLHCFPYGLEIAQLALEVTGVKDPGLLVFDADDGAAHNALCLGVHERRAQPVIGDDRASRGPGLRPLVTAAGSAPR